MKNIDVEEVVRNFKTVMGLMITEKSESANGLLSLTESLHKDGALSAKEKELICLGISICIGCETCIVLHTKASLEAGAKRDEIVEVFGIAAALRGTSVLGDIKTSADVLGALGASKRTV